LLNVQRPPERRALLHIVETPKPAAPPALVEYGGRRIAVVAGVMLAALLQMIDTTIVIVALPTIQGNLGATVDEAAWVITAYVIANVVVIPISPWLQRRIGRKKYFLISIVGFTIASILCGMATSLDELILFRIVQGAFGGGLLSTAQMILRDTFGPQQLGLSQSIFSFATVLGPSIGPTLGGWITDNLSWQWIFDVNFVPGAVATVLLWLYLRDGTKPVRESIDAPGLLLLITAVASLQYVCDQGQQDDWFSDSRITFFAVTAVVAAIAFVWRELTCAQPIVDLRVLRHRPVAIACVTIVANAVGIYAGALLLPQFTVTELGFTSTDAGMLMAARALPLVVLTFPLARIINNPRVDLRWLIGGGIFVFGIGALWLGSVMTTGSAFGSFVAPQLLCGVGVTFIYSPILVAVLRAVPSEGPKASALVILAFQLGGSVASAAFVTLLDRRQQFHQAVLAGNTTLAHPQVASFLRDHSPLQLAHLVVSQANAMAYTDALTVAGIFLLGFTPFVILLKKKGGTT
jgi:DHA2 family multidrug resistance protein